MMSRCYDESDPKYKDYGGRGITVCERWHDVENFYADMGDCPPGLQIERENNELGYFKENCYWATRKEQCRNRRSNRYILVGGVRMTIVAAAEKTGVKAPTIRYRLNSGMSDYDAVTVPVGVKKRKAHKCA